jgi:hypothetical protein
MSELLGLSREPSGANPSVMAKAMPSPASMHPKLLKADFHGSIITGLYRLLLSFYPCSHYKPQFARARTLFSWVFRES